MRIRASFTVVGISALAAASSVSASVGTPSYIEVSYQVSPYLVLKSGAAEVLDLTNLASESVFISDTDGVQEAVFELDLVKGAVGTDEADEAEVTDADPVFDIEPDFSDSVTVTDAQFTVRFSDQIDFDPATPAVDFTPVNITEADAKDVTVGELADNDDASVTDAPSLQPDIPKSDAVTATDAAPILHPQPAYDDTVTASEAIDDFDVDKVLTDSVSVTEAIENEVTIPQSDSVTAVQSSLKTFNSSVDFDPSDDDVDPDPINVSEAISEFDFSKGLTDTATTTESDAKEVTVAELADNDAASVTESIALDPESVLTDSLTAVEGIKLNPSIPVSDTTSATEAIALDIRPPFADTVTATESIDTLLTLGDSEFVYPEYVYMDDGSRRFVFNPYSYTISSTEYFVPNTGVIGAAETLNSVMLADQFVTTPEDSGGLVVNFHYTDVDEDDRALGGYYFNQTPINPGNSTTGARTIL